MTQRFEFRWDFVTQRWPVLWAGLQLTLFITVVAMALALVLGLVIALARMSRHRLISGAAQIYINVFRAIPLFVFIIWVYYGLPIVLGINFDPIPAGIACLAIQYSSWLAEIYRAGIGAVGKGQREAAMSIGLTSYQTFADVVFPQALRISLPPIGNNFIGMLKDSSLVSIIGVYELIRQSQLAVSQTFRPFEFYTATALIYIALTLMLSHLFNWLEKRQKI